MMWVDENLLICNGFYWGFEIMDISIFLEIW